MKIVYHNAPDVENELLMSALKILIIKTSALGDIIHTFPALGFLREKFGDSQIDWIVEKRCSELLLTHPHVSNVFLIDTKKWKSTLFFKSTWREIREFRRKIKKTNYDFIFDLQGNLKSGFLLSQTKGRIKVGFGWQTVAERPNCFFTNKKIDPEKGKNVREDYLAIVQGAFHNTQTFVPKPFLYPLTPFEIENLNHLIVPEFTLVCPGANWKNKRPPLIHLISFLKQLNHSHYLFAWGNEEERSLCVQLMDRIKPSRILPKLSLPLLQNLMARARLVVAMDSLPLHLCGTTKTATVSFFGPSKALKYKPLGSQHCAFQGKCPYGIIFEKRCPKLRTCPTGQCMSECFTQKNQN